jgi:hypothetical protein
MTTSILAVLTNPAAFFKDLMKKEVSLKLPAVIILFAGIIAGVYASFIAGLTGELMAQVAGSGVGTIIMVSAVIGAIVFSFIIWVIWAGVMYGISAALKGKGSFRRVLEVVAYGYIPSIIGTIISSALALVYLPQVVVPRLASVDDPQAVSSAVAALMKDPAIVDMTRISTVIGILFLLWSANIWIFGMKSARGLTTKQAAVSVMIPVLVMIVYSFSMAFVV